MGATVLAVVMGDKMETSDDDDDLCMIYATESSLVPEAQLAWCEEQRS